MIEVTKMSGERVFVNADHIETVEPHPDTVLVLSNGRHFIVKEKAEEVVARILDYQRAVRAGWSASQAAKKPGSTGGTDQD